MKEVVLVVFGGKSVEHDISVITAVQTMKNLPEQYNFLPLYIDKSGQWWIADNLQDVSVFKNFAKSSKNKKKVAIMQKTLLVEKGKKYVPKFKIKAVLNCCHGAVGENGALQGIFETFDVACTSCGVTSSALCMDKAFMKDILNANNILSAEYAYFDIQTYDKEGLPKNLEFPVIVKPANLGSSIGISVCKNHEEYDMALELAFKFDKKVLVEKLVENLREFNCACFSYGKEVFVSSVNEVKSKSDIYTFEEKYLSSESKNINAEKSLSKKIKVLTERVYKLFDCQGVVRVDFLYDNKAKALYVNEINTIPGSLSTYLFKDVSAKELLSSILQQAIKNFNEKQNLISNFDSKAIEIFEQFKPTSKK